MNKTITKLIESLFFGAALISIISLLSIVIFIFLKSIPLFAEVSVVDFIFGTHWSPSQDEYGIFPMILGSIYVTGLAILFGVPLGFLTAVYISFYAPKRFKSFLISTVNLLASIPSVVYGFFGLIVVVPIVYELFGGIGGGNSILATGIVLGIMILPTIVTTSVTALDASEPDLYAGSIALGASKEHTIFNVSVTDAKSGVYSGIVLGIGRAIGETMAVILIAGNAPVTPKPLEEGLMTTLTNPVRTLTSNIALEMSYASGLQENALFATGLVLLVMVIILNIILLRLKNKNVYK